MNPLVNKIRSFFGGDNSADCPSDGAPESGSIAADCGDISKNEVSELDIVIPTSPAELLEELRCFLEVIETSSSLLKVDGIRTVI